MNTLLTPVDNHAFHDLFLVLKELGIPPEENLTDQLKTALEIHRGLKGLGTSSDYLSIASKNAAKTIQTIVDELCAPSFQDIPLPVSFSGSLLNALRVVYTTESVVVLIVSATFSGSNERATVTLRGDHDLVERLSAALDRKYNKHA